MRRLLLVAVMCGVVSGTQAADMPDLPFLRGSFTDGLSKASVNWGGGYIGGHASHGAADMDFTNSGQDLLAKLLNNVDLEAQFNISQWPMLGKAHMQSSGFGGFIGYNFQFSEAVIGVELNYTHGNFFGANSGSQSRVFQYPVDYVSYATASSSASMKITDYGSLRARAAYPVDNFLPYGFVGVALGQANINRRADVTLNYQYVGAAVPPLPNYGGTTSLTDNANSHFITGFAGGMGVDVMLYAGLFLRAEWEHLRFSSNKNVETSVNTVKAGLGYKF
ncbi:outer membrane beta-barrel protein [Bradyrhizobium sp. SRL28]|uniref:outer membrane protein n=1 Tax=Bradyrhizobium sp. SRL28 TaxID=2836178 RepID=UPI001BDF6A8C|nr:outer membrane beta-barrel protein [Bradyrhizobium sp. SRL28]MBT1510843.1 outer membrane beta-barrel protein [Bradyrhizobium sp. SRL28]